MTGSDIIKIARVKHIEERDKNSELNAMRFIVQYQNGKTYIYKFIAASLNIIKNLNMDEVIMVQVASGISPIDNRNIFAPVVYNMVYFKERYEVSYDEEH